VETVPRIFKRIRPAFRYQRSLDVLAAADGLVTKSNLILGMGETPEEVTIAMQDLHDAGCGIPPSLSTCARRRATTRWNGGSSRRSSSSMLGPPSRSASRALWPGRWSAPPIARGASTPNPWPTTAARRRRRWPSSPRRAPAHKRRKRCSHVGPAVPASRPPDMAGHRRPPIKSLPVSPKSTHPYQNPMPEHNRADENRCRSTQDRRRLHRRSQCVASGCRDRQPRRRSR
jgi:hypothetical protein